MVEPMMYFGLGFLVSCLIALGVIALVHARAVRLTTRRIQAAAPISLAEIQADKDQLRAEFAMSTRRLEMSVEQLKEKTTNQLAELGRKTEMITRLKAELAEKAAQVAQLESRQTLLQDQLRISEEELGLKANALQEAERKLKEQEEQASKLGMNLEEKSATADSHRIEIVALRTQTTMLRDKVADLEREAKHAEERAARDRTALETAQRELGEERARAEGLVERVAQLERQLATKAAEAEAQAGRIEQLEMSVDEQVRKLGEVTRERDQLRLDLEAVRRIEQQLRDELAGIDARHQSATESLRSAKALLERQLEEARGERERMQQEVATLKRQAEASWESERMENALLRERINDVSAEVARLMVALEGAESPIEAILAEEDKAAQAPAAAANGMGNGAQNTGAAPRTASLADRIRALQHRASRAASAG